MNIPADLLYSNDHEWVKIEDGVATIGITEFAQSELGDIVFVDFSSDVDDELDAGEVFGSVEAVKTVSDLFIPVKGKIVEVNEEINDAPETVNEDPYGKGWLVKVEVSGEAKGLLDSTNYQELIGG